MSLYDELLVEYPLPDSWDPSGHVFQTQDTPEQCLARYVLRADGTLLQATSGEVIRHHGALTFYTGNVYGLAPRGYVTHDDQPAWWAEYVALYDHGHLLTIEGEKRQDPDFEGRPHFVRAAWDDARRQREGAG